MSEEKSIATDHAIERYIEREFGLTSGEALGSVRTRQRALAAMTRDLASYPIHNWDAEVRVPVGRLVYVVRDGAVITVLWANEGKVA